MENTDLKQQEQKTELSATDILNKGSDKKVEPQASDHSTDDINIDDLKGDMSLESITDPIARRIAQDKIDNLYKGFNKKYEAIAHLKKDLEAKQATLDQQSQASRSWDINRFNETMKDPEFVKLAQQAQQAQAPADFKGSNEEWSAMSEGEQNRFKAMETELLQMKQDMAQDRSKLEVDRLKEKYNTFDEARLNSFVSDVQSGKYKPSQEDAWKIVNHDDAIKHAYQMGLEGRNQGLSEKMNATGINGNINTSTSSGDIPEEVLAACKRGDHGAIARWRMSQR